MIVEGVSKCDFAMSRDVACRVSMFATTYKTFNIKILRLYCHNAVGWGSFPPMWLCGVTCFCQQRKCTSV